MTKSDQPKSAPTPLLLVYGKPTSPALPQASWFRIEERQAVIAAAKTLRFNVIEIATEADRALLAGVHEGVLKGQERMIIGSVAVDVYQRIEDYVRKAAGGAASSAAITENTGANAASEQKANVEDKNTTSSAPAPGAAQIVSTANPSPPTSSAAPASSPTPGQTLRVGARVLAAYWNETREFEGFWLATVKRVEAGEFTLEWVAAPKFPPFTAPPKNIAVPHPEFRPSGK